MKEVEVGHSSLGTFREHLNPHSNHSCDQRTRDVVIIRSECVCEMIFCIDNLQEILQQALDGSVYIISILFIIHWDRDLVQ